MKGEEEERGNGRNPSLDISGSVPKRPGRPSLGPDGTGILASVQTTARGGLAGTAGVSASQVVQFSG